VRLWFHALRTKALTTHETPYEPTAQDIAAARTDWTWGVSKRAGRVLVPTLFTLIIIESSGNIGVLFNQRSWDPTVGVTRDNSLAIVAVMVALAATICVSIVVAPRASEERAVLDRLALVQWSRWASESATRACGVALAVALMQVPVRLAWGLLLILCVQPAIVLSVVTGQRVHDQGASRLLWAEVELLRSALDEMTAIGGRDSGSRFARIRSLMGMLLFSLLSASIVWAVPFTNYLLHTANSLVEFENSGTPRSNAVFLLVVFAVPHTTSLLLFFYLRVAVWRSRAYRHVRKTRALQVVSILWIVFAQVFLAVGTDWSWDSVATSMAVFGWPLLTYVTAVAIRSVLGIGPGDVAARHTRALLGKQFQNASRRLAKQQQQAR
jgi:hypothetical protein